MAEQQAVGGHQPIAGTHGTVQYDNVDQSYLEQRKLKKSAGWILLWALGVGAVISGDFFGWNYGLPAGGFGGMLVATIVVSVMYLCMVFSIAELSAALPHAGGFYSFTRSAFGPTLGFINGVSDIIEYVVTPAVIVISIAGYMQTLIPGVPTYVWWVAFYAVFVGINILGTALTLRVGLVVTLLAIAVLAIFYVGAVASGAFQWDKVFNVVADPQQPAALGASSFLPFGFYGIFAALPFAIWFYLAIEQLPLAAEESHNAASDMPKALIGGIITLLALSIFTLVLNAGVGGGASEVGASLAPLDIGFKAIFGTGATQTLLTVAALTGLIASFHTIIYAYGRVLFALSRSGYIPRFISVTSAKYHTPARALVIGGVVGLGLALLIDRFAASVGAALLTMSVFGAVISYALVLLSYIKLAISKPELPRPYRSPLGVPGAVVGVVLAVISLIATMAIESNRPGVIGTAVFLAAMIVYYYIYSRKHLVAQAPEEEAAILEAANAELKH
ncbi:ethanolamine permease [Chloroflexia bacterium SDU3-3]|nr:ethanolamine permease [Chloroflexia bacterium SDU3-3]